MDLYYGLDGEPISHDEWSDLVADKYRARSAAQDEATSLGDDPTRIGWDDRDGIQVSTVWLGVNHSFGDGPPLMFETVVFGGDHDREQWRYSTPEEAEAGHRAACDLVWGT